MELRHIRYFVAVAEALHFTRAAAKLRIAQPALSQQIRALEDELGVRLLERTNRKVTLTHAGSVFLEESRALLASAQRATMRAVQADRGQVGRLNIGYVLSTTGRTLTRAVRDFTRTHPDVDLVLHDFGEAQQWMQLLDGQLDIAITRTRKDHDALASRPLERGHLTVLLPPGHRLATKTKITLKQLAGEPFIIGRDADFPSYNQFLRSLCQQAGFELRVRQQVRDLASIHWMVSASMSLGFSSSGLEDLCRKETVTLPLHPKIPTKLWLQWRRTGVSPTLKHFLATLLSSRPSRR
jgi:DNA-binding transcriptional LysR family regulator